MGRQNDNLEAAAARSKSKSQPDDGESGGIEESRELLQVLADRQREEQRLQAIQEKELTNISEHQQQQQRAGTCTTRLQAIQQTEEAFREKIRDEGPTSFHHQQSQQQQSPEAVAATESSSLRDLPPTRRSNTSEPGAVAVAGPDYDEYCDQDEEEGDCPSPSPMCNSPSPPPAAVDDEDDNHNHHGTETFTAQAVTRKELEEEIEDVIMSQAVRGEVIQVVENSTTTKPQETRGNGRLLIVLAIVVVVAATAILLAIFLGRQSATTAEEPTLEEQVTAIVAKESRVAFQLGPDEPLDMFVLESPQQDALEWLINEVYYEGFPNETEQLLEAYAIATLYYSTQGANTLETTRPPSVTSTALSTSWMVGLNPCTWVESPETNFCSVETNRVEHLVYQDMNAQGMLPENELVFLTELRVLDMRHNQLTGSLPRLLPSSLEHILLDDNNLEGDIPEEWGETLTNLQRLSLTQNPNLTISEPGTILEGWENGMVLSGPP